MAIGILGLGLALLLAKPGELSALTSRYETTANNWHQLDLATHLLRYAAVVLLLSPTPAGN